MTKTTMLAIVPKNNHNQISCWCFDTKDKELAEQTLQKEFPDGTHEIILTDCYELTAEEDNTRAFKGSWE